LVISNYDSFRVLFDKIASVYFIWEKYTNILPLEMASPGNWDCADCIGTLSFPIAQSLDEDRATSIIDVKKRSNKNKKRKNLTKI